MGAGKVNLLVEMEMGVVRFDKFLNLRAEFVCVCVCTYLLVHWYVHVYRTFL